MKRFIAILLIVVSLCILTACNRITINYDGNATLKFQGTAIGDNAELTEFLTEEETRDVKAYLSSAKYSYDGAGCPFNKNISITFGEQAFCIAYDDCPTVWLAGSDKYYTMSEEGRDYIISLFEKYVGYFPAP